MAEEQEENSHSSLLDHLEDFRWTLLWSLGAVVVMAVPGIIFVPDLLMKYVRYVCPPEISLHYFTPFEPLIVELELGVAAGAVAALPFILYKVAQFVSPGLYLRERRWGFLFILSSLLLMGTGVVLALAAVIPIVMNFSLTFAADKLQPVIGLSAFLHFSALLAAGFALVFELPVALLLAIRCGLVSVETLRRKRPVIVVTLFVFAALLTPPDVVSQLLMGIPGWILFELTLFIGGKLSPKEETEEVSAPALPMLPEESPGSGENSCGAAVPEEEETLCGSAETESAPGSGYVDDAPYRSAARKKRRIRPL